MAHTTDILVIGSGVAGMWFALQAAKLGRVTVISKREATESNSRYAQGGIAAVWDSKDSLEDHVQDTFVAGAGLCRPEAVHVTVHDGPERVRELIEAGAKFTRKGDHPDAAYSLHQEGGHSARRILHADDMTGAEIVRALYERLEAEPNVTILDQHVAVDLITSTWLAQRQGRIPSEDDQVLGAYVLDAETGEVETWTARFVVLATGGVGKVYLYTTNPDIATGDGMAMAYRAGALMANLEFVQFHPTSLFHPKERSFLVSEALRGEGGKLILPDGTRFMPAYDERLELAPRDIVARAIDSEIKKRGLQHVLLDMTHLSREVIEQKFPNIDRKLLALGIDMATTPIPVVPAAHYMCGGVKSDLAGESSIRNLFAIGEVACTGLHGANRLASNSLLEAVVFAHRAAEEITKRFDQVPLPSEIPEWDTGHAVDNDEGVVIQQTWEEIRRFMWNYVGIVRTHRRLKRAQHRIRLVQREINQYYWDFKLTPDLVELRNLADCSEMIIECALRRQESRGLHYTLDFPQPDDRFLRDTVIRKNEL